MCILNEVGVKIVVIGDYIVSFYDKGGFDIEVVFVHTCENCVFDGFDVLIIVSEELLIMLCDVFILVVFGDVIDVIVVKKLNCELVVEVVNGFIMFEGDEVFYGRGISVLLDIYVNAGGVMVSYFEWV